MRTELELIAHAAKEGGLLSDRERKRLGYSDERWARALAAGRWLEVAPGWYRHAATPLTFAMEATAGSAWLRTKGGLYAESALHWLGVDVPEPARAEFLVPRHRRSAGPQPLLHSTTRWDPADLILHRRVRTCTATRALIDFAGRARSASELEAAIDSAIRLRRTALPRLTKRLATVSGFGMAGSVLLRELLLDSGGESYLERRFLQLVRPHGLPRPDCQVTMRRDHRVARVDFRFPSTNVVVEVTGRLGHASDAERAKDARRRNDLQLSGQQVIEFTTAHVIDDPDYVIATLRHAGLVAR